MIQEYIHRLTIPENQPVTAESGVPVGQIPAALDDDGAEENRQACYRIEQTNGGRTAPFFLKSPDSRVLMTNESLDREAQAVYKLRIRVYDCAQQCQTISDGTKFQLLQKGWPLETDHRFGLLNSIRYIVSICRWGSGGIKFRSLFGEIFMVTVASKTR